MDCLSNQQAEQMQEIELEQDRAMLYVPHNAIEGTLEFKIYLNGEIKTVHTTLNQDELREAVRKAEEGYIDEDDRFCLTDKGRELAEYLAAHPESNLY